MFDKMDLTLTVLIQVCIMLILIAVGFLTYKAKLMNETGQKQLSNLLLYIVMPAVIINAYRKEFQADLLSGLLWSFALAFVSHFIAIAVAHLLFRKKEGDRQNAINRFAGIYSNCAFMAIPLIQSLLGDTGVFYASAYTTVFNLLSWTHGVFLMSGSATRKDVKKAMLSPVIISVVIGLILFFGKIPLPQLISAPIEYLAALNTPLAMIVAGLAIAQTNILSAFSDLKIYAVTAVRNLLIPQIMLVILRLLPLDNTLLLCNLIETACPTAAICIMFATKYDLDAAHASKIMAMTTVLSIITIPLMVFLFQIGR